MAEPARRRNLTLVQHPPLCLLHPHLPLLLPWAGQAQVVRAGGELVHLGEEGLGKLLSVPGETYPHLETETLEDSS